MDADKLIRMANQIGDFFVVFPNQNEGELGIANHIAKFWEPRMRQQLLAHIDAHPQCGLNECVLAALTKHRNLLG